MKQKLIKQWTGKSLVIPETLNCYSTKDSSGIKRKHSHTFVHYFNGSCESCVIHLKSLNSFVNSLKAKNVKLYIIAYTTLPGLTSKLIKETELNFHVHIDSLNSFYFENKLNSPLLESFLLDMDNKIICLGELKDKKFRKKIIDFIDNL